MMDLIGAAGDLLAQVEEEVLWEHGEGFRANVDVEGMIANGKSEGSAQAIPRARSIHGSILTSNANMLHRRDGFAFGAPISLQSLGGLAFNLAFNLLFPVI